jgi:hypothetical protein
MSQALLAKEAHPTGPLGFDIAQNRQTLRPSVSSHTDPPPAPLLLLRSAPSGNPLGPLGLNFSQHGPTTRPSVGPLGFECSQHRQALRPSVDGTRSKALRPFGLQ